jgi:hypothetical protein
MTLHFVSGSNINPIILKEWLPPAILQNGKIYALCLANMSDVFILFHGPRCMAASLVLVGTIISRFLTRYEVIYWSNF